MEPRSDPLIYRDEMLATIGALADLVVDVREIREIREDQDEEEEEEDEEQIGEEARIEAENSPIVKQLRELYARGMAELEARREADSRG